MSLTNSQFHDLVDTTQRNLEDIIDNGDIDIDLESSGGILTLTFENQQQVILSRQEPLKQLWLADRSGGFHFDYDSEKNTWYCATTEQTLVQMLSEILHTHTQHNFDLSSL